MVINIRKKSSGIKVDEILFEHKLGSSKTGHQKNITCFNRNKYGIKNHGDWELKKHINFYKDVAIIYENENTALFIKLIIATLCWDHLKF